MEKTDYKILVVEDELLVATDIEESLTALGYTVQKTVDTGLGAIAEVERLLPDLILMDINLKGEMSGIEAAKQIIQTHDVPIIYLTANADLATINKAKVALPYGYIIKPFTDKDLQINIEIAIFKFQNDLKFKMESEQFATFFNLKDHDKNQIIVHSQNNTLEKVNIDQVYFIKGDQNETTIHLLDEEIKLNKDLDSTLSLFPIQQFIQINDEYYINKEKVFIVKYPEIIMSDKMTVISIDPRFRNSLSSINAQMDEIIDKD